MRNLSVENMVEDYIQSWGDSEIDDIFKALTIKGYISQKNWNRYVGITTGLHLVSKFAEDTFWVDSEGRIVWEYDTKRGCFVKTAH